MQSKFYKYWIKTIKKNKNILLKKRLVGKVQRKLNDEKISVLDTKIKTKKKEILSRAIILELPSVVIVPVFIIKNKKKFGVIKQFRISQGKETLEFPAGAIKNSKKIQSALDEIKEEININLKKKDLKSLSSKPILMMPSYNSSLAYFYYFEKRIDTEMYLKINNSNSGLVELGEKIIIKIIDEKEIKKITTSSVVIGYSLYKNKK